MLKLLMSWDVRETHEQQHLEFLTSDFIPMLMKYGRLSDAWLSMAGDSPEMILGIISEDVEIRSFLGSAEWEQHTQQLTPFIENFRAWLTATIQQPGGFQM